MMLYYGVSRVPYYVIGCPDMITFSAICINASLPRISMYGAKLKNENDGKTAASTSYVVWYVKCIVLGKRNGLNIVTLFWVRCCLILNENGLTIQRWVLS